MPSGPAERYDFFLSRRGSVAAIAIEVTDVLKEKGYKVHVRGLRLPFRCELRRGHARRHQELARPPHPITPLTTKRRSTPARSSLASRRSWRKAREERHIISACAVRTCRCADCLPTMSYQDLVGVAGSAKNASAASSPPQSANRRQHHRHRDRSSGCRRASRASRVALTNLTGSTPS